MGPYIIRRVLWVFVLLLAISILTFIIFTVLPAGDPAALRAGRRPSPELLISIRETLGLNRPRCVQFHRFLLDSLPFVKYDTSVSGSCVTRFDGWWLVLIGLCAIGGAFSYLRKIWGGVAAAVTVALIFTAFDSLIVTPGTFFDSIQWSTASPIGIDFGQSFQRDTRVLDDILDLLPTTAFLTAGAVLLWLSIGIPIGILSALRTRSLADRFVMICALIAISAPVYFLGLIALYLFDDDIGKFAFMPGNSAYQDADNLLEKAGALVMPWMVLAASFAAIYARFLRGNLIEVMSEDYIRTARAKGLSERRVVLRHGVRSALTPIVTLLGLDVGILLGGAILTETVFNIQGLGRYAYDAIQRTDLPVIQGTVLFGALFIALMNLIVDIIYAFLDPRVRYS